MREPLRLSGYTALTVGLALQAAIGWGAGLGIRAIVAQTATLALTSIGGLEWARGRVTPVADPRAADGEPLYTAHDVSAIANLSRSVARP